MPAPNTIAYTTANVISDVHTLPAASVGVTASAVRSSAVDDPRLAADLDDVPAREQCDEAGRQHRSSIRAATSGESNRRPRRHAHSEARVSSSISMPSPTITRKA